MTSMEDRDGLIWTDGKLIPWRDARLHILSYTVLVGAGVFEGVRAYAGDRGTAIFRLNDHTERLFDSAKILQMPMAFSSEEINKAHIDTVRANALGECYIRASAIYDGKVTGVSAQGNDVHVYIVAWEWNHYLTPDAERNGIRVKTSTFNRFHINSMMRKSKTNGHYVNSMLAIQEAKQQGFNDALMLDPQGFVAECSTSNVFVVRRGVISTPDRTGILEGITRDTIMTLAADRGMEVQERRITRDELYCADEVFVTGTAAEVVSVVELDNRAIGSGHRGQVTESLQKAYRDAITGKDSKHLDWLTPVG